MNQIIEEISFRIVKLVKNYSFHIVPKDSKIKITTVPLKPTQNKFNH